MKKLRIMIVEDETLNAVYLKELMSRKGHEVISLIEKGADAVRLALTDKPDLILMDIRLRDNISGIDAVREIHKSFYIPVIYVTAYADITTILSAKETKMLAFLIKPIDEKVLNNLIEREFDIENENEKEKAI